MTADQSFVNSDCVSARFLLANTSQLAVHHASQKNTRILETLVSHLRGAHAVLNSSIPVSAITQNPMPPSSHPSQAPKSNPSPTQTCQLALPLKASDNTLHLHLTLYSHSLVLFVTTKAGEALEAALLQAGDSGGGGEDRTDSQTTGNDTISLGSFVVGMPDLVNVTKPDPSTTPLYTNAQSLDLCTRLCRILTTKLQRAGCTRQVYVGICGGIKFWTAEEEAEVVRGTVEAVMEQVEET